MNVYSYTMMAKEKLKVAFLINIFVVGIYIFAKAKTCSLCQSKKDYDFLDNSHDFT